MDLLVKSKSDRVSFPGSASRFPSVPDLYHFEGSPSFKPSASVSILSPGFSCICVRLLFAF